MQRGIPGSLCCGKSLSKGKHIGTVSWDGETWHQLKAYFCTLPKNSWVLNSETGFGTETRT